MNKSLKLFSKSSRCFLNLRVTKENLSLCGRFPAANTFKINYNQHFFTVNPIFYFSSTNSETPHQHNLENNRIKKHDHKHKSGDTLKQMRQKLQKLSFQAQQKHPDRPDLVIKELYGKCQILVGQNKKVEILMLFELICQFIESKNLVEQYSSFLVMSAANSFMMGKYQQVERRCRLALPFQLKKHGQKHRSIGDIYNMLGISISKSSSGKSSQALQFLEKAFTIRKQIHGESGQAAEVLFNAGIIEQQNEKMFEKAEKNYLDAVQMLQNSQIPMPLLYIKTKMRLSQVQYKIHQVASKYISDMLRIQELIQKYKGEKKFKQNEVSNVDMFLSLLHRNLGKKFLQSKDNQNAVKYFEKCLNYLRKNNMETQDRIEVLQLCAIALNNLTQFQKAINLLNQLQKIVLSFPSNADYYKFNLWKFQNQIYRNTLSYEKELNNLEKILKLFKQTKQNFVKTEDVYETNTFLIYCLSNMNKFDRAIKVGQQFLETLEKDSLLTNDLKNDMMATFLAYIGFAYAQKDEIGKSLEYFIKSDNIFSKADAHVKRNEFHSNIIRKIAHILIRKKEDFEKGFEYLQKLKSHILAQQQTSLPKRFNDLVLLLLDYEVEAGMDNVQIINKLIEAKYIHRINNVLAEILKCCQSLASGSQKKQNREALSNYYILIDSIYQMLISFGKIKQYPIKQSDLTKMKEVLLNLIKVYESVFKGQIQQVVSGTSNRDEALKVAIKKALAAKKQLQQLK